MSYLWEAKNQPEPNAAFAMTLDYNQRHSRIDALPGGQSRLPYSFLNNLSPHALPILSNADIPSRITLSGRKGGPMSWKEQLDKAIAAIKDAAESDKARDLATKAKSAALVLARKARNGAVSAADAFVEANRDPSSLQVRFLNVELIVMSPSEGISVTRPDAATLVVADGQGNGLVINAAADPAFVAETIGSVSRLSGNTFDLGPEDGINVVVTKF
jgi:hypothetical protein